MTHSRRLAYQTWPRMSRIPSRSSGRRVASPSSTTLEHHGADFLARLLGAAIRHQHGFQQRARQPGLALERAGDAAHEVHDSIGAGRAIRMTPQVLLEARATNRSRCKRATDPWMRSIGRACRARLSRARPRRASGRRRSRRAPRDPSPRRRSACDAQAASRAVRRRGNSIGERFSRTFQLPAPLASSSTPSATSFDTSASLIERSVRQISRVCSPSAGAGATIGAGIDVA